MFPNAELAFIIYSSSYQSEVFFCARISRSWSIFRSVRTVSFGGPGIALLTLEVHYLVLISWYWKKISLKTTVGIKQKQVKHEYHRRHKITI
jgi:hypothetical protein